LYTVQRTALHNKIAHIAPFTLRTLLHGYKQLSKNDNRPIYEATLTFIIETKRFSNQ
jgi:hypothetical protein